MIPSKCKVLVNLFFLFSDLKKDAESKRPVSRQEKIPSTATKGLLTERVQQRIGVKEKSAEKGEATKRSALLPPKLTSGASQKESRVPAFGNFLVNMVKHQKEVNNRTKSGRRIVERGEEEEVVQAVNRADWNVTNLAANAKADEDRPHMGGGVRQPSQTDGQPALPGRKVVEEASSGDRQPKKIEEERRAFEERKNRILRANETSAEKRHRFHR